MRYHHGKRTGIYLDQSGRDRRNGGQICRGNLLERYLNLKTLEKEPLKLDVETSVDAVKVAQFVESKCSAL